MLYFCQRYFLHMGVCLVIYLLNAENYKVLKWFPKLIYYPGRKRVSQDQNNLKGAWQSLKALLGGDTYLLSRQFYPWSETVTKELAFGCVETVKEAERVVNLNPFVLNLKTQVKPQRWTSPLVNAFVPGFTGLPHSNYCNHHKTFLVF